MESTNMLQHGQSLCRQCQKYFGDPARQSLCSVCYKSKSQVGQSAEPHVAVEPTIIKKDQPKDIQANSEPGRCQTCRRKIGLLGFTCRCKFDFCKLHRLPEEHQCQFDFQQRQRQRLAKENPMVKARQLSEI